MRNPRPEYAPWLSLMAGKCNPNRERTAYAQRKARQGIRTEIKNGYLCVVRLDSKGHGLAVSAQDLQRWHGPIFAGARFAR